MLVADRVAGPGLGAGTTFGRGGEVDTGLVGIDRMSPSETAIGV